MRSSLAAPALTCAFRVLLSQDASGWAQEADVGRIRRVGDLPGRIFRPDLFLRTPGDPPVRLKPKKRHFKISP